jgi:hypothetical protein
MRSAEAPGRHLTQDEVVDRVFPADEEPAPVPLHLAACPDCQEKVSTLREGWLLDRGAVAGFVETLPPSYWNSQTASILGAVSGPSPAELPRPIPFSIQRSFVRRPALAFGSLAAALALVGVISWSRFRGHSEPVTVAQQKPIAAAPVASEETDKKDDELLRQIDDLLADEGPISTLVPEGVS